MKHTCNGTGVQPLLNSFKQMQTKQTYIGPTAEAAFLSEIADARKENVTITETKKMSEAIADAKKDNNIDYGASKEVAAPSNNTQTESGGGVPSNNTPTASKNTSTTSKSAMSNTVIIVVVVVVIVAVAFGVFMYMKMQKSKAASKAAAAVPVATPIAL